MTPTPSPTLTSVVAAATAPLAPPAAPVTAAATEGDLLDRVLRCAGGQAPPSTGFAVLRRRSGAGADVLLGEVVDVDHLADIPLPAASGLPVLALVPFRQVRERGFAHHDDGTPLRVLVAREHALIDVADLLRRLPADSVHLVDAAFDVDDETYAEQVRRVISDEIGRGEGANFVLRRDLVARMSAASTTSDGSADYGDGAPAAPSGRAALALLRRLLTGEPGAYWAFAIQAGDVTLVGATPERHVSVESGGRVVMNPISGTYRYPASGPTTADLLRFLADPKETEELSMVVDEELKMMSRVCSSGGQVLGPTLAPMSRLAHTEYELVGRTGLDVRDVLRATMFAATVTGSPVGNACRVIAKYEQRGRGYYSGTAALLTREPDGAVALDSPILIRTAYLSPDGTVRVPVGATLVRHSVPQSEVAETHAKVAGLLGAFGDPAAVGEPAGSVAPVVEETVALQAIQHPASPGFARRPGVAEALAARNDALAGFWVREQTDRPLPGLVGRTALVVDAEDDWTAMLAHVLRRLGMSASVRAWNDPAAGGDVDLVVAGPGPGDPTDLSSPRMAALRDLLAARLAARRPTLAVCLSHQILAGLLGLDVGPLPSPYQGTQRRVRVFGRDARVGFYNTFSARVPADLVAEDGSFATGAGVRGWAVPRTGEVLALEGPAFVGVQFHLESVISPDGVSLLGELLTRLLET